MTRQSPPCPPGCTCRRHSMRRCSPECTCDKHRGEPSYSARHKNVYKTRGKADQQLCKECGQQARQWAQLHGTDGKDPNEHYVPMCSKCHLMYDGVHEKAAEGRRRKVWTPEDRKKRAEITRSWSANKTSEERSNSAKKAWETRRKNKEEGQQIG